MTPQAANLLNKKCRVCLQEQLNLNLVINKYEVNDSYLTISEMFLLCTGLDDDISTFSNASKLCDDCINELIRAYKFRHKCLESHKSILSLYSRNELDEDDKEDMQCMSSPIANDDPDSDPDYEPPEEILIKEEEPDNEIPNVKFEFCNVDLDDNTVEIDQTENKAKTKTKSSPKKTRKKKSKKITNCGLCDAQFKTELILKAHVIMEHDKTGQCFKCPKVFKSYTTLRNHLIKHSTYKMHICDVCGKQLFNRTNLISHMRTHTGEKPFKCSECDYACAQQAYLTKHMIVHTKQRTFKCRFCDKTYAFHSGRDYHEKSHSSERPFVCAYCGKTFNNRTLWKEHLLTHQPELHVPCEYCGKKFARKKNLKIHLRLHTGSPFCCELCGKTFIQNACLRMHIKKNHPDHIVVATTY